MWDATTRDRFEAKIARGESCWKWTAARQPNGYGLFNLPRSIAPTRKSRLAHRIAYEFYVGPIPPGLQIDHLCRNRACVNPTHLEPVTARENILRGEGVTAQNARRTSCKRGHPLVPIASGGRYCRKCAVEAVHRYRARRRVTA